MPRKMQNAETGSVVTVYQTMVLRNFWEIYILDNEKTDIRYALTLGDYNEFGDISMAEVKPFVISATRNMDEVMPAPGWKWVD